MHRYRAVLTLAVALAAGCRTAATPPPTAVPVATRTPAPAAAPTGTTPAPSSRGSVPVESWPCPKVPDSVHWARNSAEHRAAFLQGYRLATAQVEKESAGRKPGTWAVILDADETVIDNALYQKERGLVGLPYTRESWNAWAARLEAPPLPGAMAFLQRVHQLGGLIAIVTNRRAEICAATVDDFKKYGIPYDAMLCRPDGAAEAKEPRFDAVARCEAIPGHGPLDVVMWVGDNIKDFPGQSQDLRSGPEAALDSFGFRFIVLPNPMYGSWFDNPRE